jgi:sphingosine kinase
MGLKTFSRVVRPILEAGQCSLNITCQYSPQFRSQFHELNTDTSHRNHAHQIAQEMSLDYDSIVTLSGDGLIHEVLNGLAERSDAEKALNIPIAPIPTGSANGMCVNIFGIEVCPHYLLRVNSDT